MNLTNIFNEIEKADPEIYERVSMRRDVVKNWSRKVALAAVPFALGSLLSKAYGKTTDTITDVLNFALKLEYLERDYYQMGLSTMDLIPAGVATAIFNQVSTDEANHVSFLQATITALGDTYVPEPAFDFTGHGLYPNVFSDYPTFLAVAQAFEDTGIRAYKGQAGNLTSNPDLLTHALRIHSVEGRHAAQIHLLRNVSPFIKLKDSQGLPASAQPTYNGEENTIQGDLQVTGINGASQTLASQSFDEPLTKQQVLDIVTPFFA